MPELSPAELNELKSLLQRIALAVESLATAQDPQFESWAVLARKAAIQVKG